MAKKAKTVVGFCPTIAHAEEAVDRLRLSGFRNTDISILMKDDGDVSSGALRWIAGPAMPKNEARHHEEWISRGGIVISVRCEHSAWERRAEHVLERSFAAAG
jgi:hypothetical protein